MLNQFMEKRSFSKWSICDKKFSIKDNCSAHVSSVHENKQIRSWLKELEVKSSMYFIHDFVAVFEL